MTAETKLSVTYKSEAMPPVYVANKLNLGEQGALVVYNETTSAIVDGKTVKTVTPKAIAIRFAASDSLLADDSVAKLVASIPNMLSSYTKTDSIPTMILSGVVDYEFFHNTGMGMTNVTVKIGDVNLAQAHFLGQTPKANAEPSQYVWFIGATDVPVAIKATVDSCVPAILTKELYGG